MIEVLSTLCFPREKSAFTLSECGFEGASICHFHLSGVFHYVQFRQATFSIRFSQAY